MKQFFIIDISLCSYAIQATCLRTALQEAREQGIIPIHVRQGHD